MSKILLVGGTNGMGPVYRRCVESHGYECDHRERSNPPDPACLRGEVRGHVNQIALIVVFAGCCSHPQRKAAEELATATRTPIVYLRQPSLSALRRALQQHQEVARV